MTKNNMKWSFYQIWNESLERDKSRILKPRERIWATELDSAFIDRYLKMKGVEPTNPPNARSKRKFEAGNIWEAIIGYVLNRAGILQSQQEWVGYQYPDLLPVSGYLDFTAGGTPDYDKASSIVQTEFNWLPPFISQATLNIVTKLKERFPNGLKNIILEIKSCSSFMFERYEKNQEASLSHRLQEFHYLKAKNMDEGHIVYICKDDARLLEIGVFNPSPLEEIYKKSITEMTHYIRNNIEPEKEKYVVFNDERFAVNWKVLYSGYLTKLYGFKDQDSADRAFKPMVTKWNRVLGRVRENKDMTDNNLEAIDEMKEYGFDIDKCREIA